MGLGSLRLKTKGLVLLENGVRQYLPKNGSDLELESDSGVCELSSGCGEDPGRGLET